MSYHVRNLFFVGKGWRFWATVEDGVIVLRARPRGAPDRRDAPESAQEITRLHWQTHLNAPTEPLHPDILQMIGDRMAEVACEAHTHGYMRAQRDVQAALGIG